MAFVMAVVQACKHETDELPNDLELPVRASDAEADVWYQFSDALLPRLSVSGHAQALLRTCFNEIAFP